MSTFTREDLERDRPEEIEDEEVEAAASDEDEGDAEGERAQREHTETRTTRTHVDDRDVQLRRFEPVGPMPSMQDADVMFDDDKYREKMRDWQARTARNEARALMNQEAIGRKQDEMVAKGRRKYKDFDTVVNNPTLLQHQLCAEAAIAVFQHRNADDMLYYFGKNLKEAIRVASLPPAEQIAEIGELSYRIRNVTRGGSAQRQSDSGQRSQGGNTQRTSAESARDRAMSKHTSMDDFARQSRQEKKARRPSAYR